MSMNNYASPAPASTDTLHDTWRRQFGIMIQDASGGAQPVFYVADIQIVAAPAPAVVHLNVNAAQTLRAADARWFGVNMANWDGYLNNSTTATSLSIRPSSGPWPTRSESASTGW